MDNSKYNHKIASSKELLQKPTEMPIEIPLAHIFLLIYLFCTKFFIYLSKIPLTFKTTN